MFPTEENRWVALEDGLFEIDDTRIAKLYTGKSIHFLQWSDIATKGKRETSKEESIKPGTISTFSSNLPNP